ncbi:MAG: hypothetical protein ABR613_11775 [Actinomycetota bacterium]
MNATYSHDFEGERYQLPIDRDDNFRLELMELGLRVSFDLAQENESSPPARRCILSDRFAQAVV